MCRTALHWACKRGHATIAQILLQNSADVSIKTFKGELPHELTTSTEVLAVLKIEPDEKFTKRCSEGTSQLPIVPNYLKSPVFPYDTSDSDELESMALASPTVRVDVNSTSKRTGDVVDYKSVAGLSTCETSGSGKNLASETKTTMTSPLIVRARVSDSGDKDNDFVEVEVPSLNYCSLLKSCCEELELTPEDVAKIRKLPNVWIRKDKDIQRLKEGQELEIILKTE